MESRSASVTDFFSSDREAQASVVQGLFGLGCCFAGLAVFWFACLFILKCKGKKEAGCAAGYGFENINDYMDEQAEEEYLNSLDPQRPEHLPQQITISPNNTFDAEDYSDEPPLKNSPSSSSLRIIAIAATEPEDFCDEAISDELDYCDSPPQSSPNSSVSECRSPDSDFGYKHHTPSPQEIKTLMALEDYESDIAKVSRQLHSLPPPPPVPPIRSSSRFCTSSIRCGGCCSSHPSDTYTRRQWTRITFLISAVISIGCCAMILTEVRDPIKDVSQEVSELFVEGHAIIDQVQTTVNIMEDAAEVADETIAAIPLNLTKMCPGVPTRRNFTAEFALDPRGVIRFLQKDFETFLVRTARNIDEIQGITSKVEHGLTHAGILVEENIDNLWIVGFFAWTTIALTALLINGVAIAINTDSKRKQQQQELSGTSTTTKNHNNDTTAEQVLGWVILPTFIICIIIGWCLLIATSLSTVVASDVCVARGSPEETIRQALKIWELQEDEFVYNKVIAYTEVSVFPLSCSSLCVSLSIPPNALSYFLSCFIRNRVVMAIILFKNCFCLKICSMKN